MRKNKIFKIDDREVTIKELRVKDILSIFEGADKQGNVMGVIADLLSRCSDLQITDLEEMAPSELKLIYEGFREVNDVFFEAARQWGLGGTIEELKKSIQKEFSAALAVSFSQDTPTPSTTDTATS